MVYVNAEERGVFSYAAVTNQRQAFELFRDNLDYSEGDYLTRKDIYGKSAKEYLAIRGWELE